MIQFQQILYFLKVAELQSINRASDELYISQPNLSYAIKKLEMEVGTELLTRSNKGVRLTERGKEFLKYARKIYEQMNLIEEMSDRNREDYLTVASYPMLITADLITEFYEKYGSDNMNIVIDEYRLEHVIELVDSSLAEIGIIQINTQQRGKVFKDLSRKHLEYHPLTEGIWYVIVSENHPLAECGEVSADDLMDYPLIRARDDFYSTISAHIQIGEQQWGDFPKVFYANDGHTRVDLIRKTDAFLTAPTWVVNAYDNEDLVCLSIKDNAMSTELGWIKRRKEDLTDSGKHFVEILEKNLK